MKESAIGWKERIRDLRKERKLSQVEIATLLQISQRTYSDYETGKVRIPIGKLITLAKYYDCCMDYITGTTTVCRPFPYL